MNRFAPTLPEILGESSEIAELRRRIMRMLRLQVGARLPPILIQGETGTGKGLLAQSIHRASSRYARPFVEVDCAAIPETLLEAELFGVERGAFTDARQARAGLFESAHGGTIFLDEVGLLSRDLQSKFLRVVEQKEVRRLGGTRILPLDVCIISATNVRLLDATREGSFRQDLYHRLAAVTLDLPPLRMRGADIPLLAQIFITRACLKYELPPKALSLDARDAMMAYPWPGNLRELLNVAERATLLSEESVITAARLELDTSAGESLPAVGPSNPRASVGSFDRSRLQESLEAADGRLSAAARQLGMPRNTLRYRLAKLGIPLRRARADERAG